MTEQAPDHGLPFTELLAGYDETLAGGADSRSTECVRAEASVEDSIQDDQFQKLCDCLELLEFDRGQQRSITNDTLDLRRSGLTLLVDVIAGTKLHAGSCVATGPGEGRVFSTAGLVLPAPVDYDQRSPITIEAWVKPERPVGTIDIGSVPA